MIGTAGDRPDDSLRAIGRLAADRGDRVVIKESLTFLRGRSRASIVGEFVAGARSGGIAAADIQTYIDELEALKAVLAERPEGPRVVVEMCHEQRPEVRAWLLECGFTEVEDPRVLRSFPA